MENCRDITAAPPPPPPTAIRHRLDLEEGIKCFMAKCDTRKSVEYPKALVRVRVFLHKLYEVQYSYITQQWNKYTHKAARA